MSKKFNKRSKHKKCEVCDECIAIGEGDHLCGKTNKLVIEGYIPTDDYISCQHIKDSTELSGGHLW